MKLYTSQSRQEVLEKLHKALASDERIGGVLLVGSGAYGFFDEFSDLDLAVVVNEGQDALAVFRDWDSVIQNLLPVLWRFADIRAPEVGLYALILTDFLEVDISFQSLSALSARSPNWKVLFDRTDRIEEIQRVSQSEHVGQELGTVYGRRLDSIWHFVTHAAISIKRGDFWRATYYISEIRNRIIELEGLICHRQTRHFREVDRLPPSRLAVLERTFPRRLESDELVRALSVATDCFFETAARIDRAYESKRSQPLREAMEQYLSLMT